MPPEIFENHPKEQLISAEMQNGLEVERVEFNNGIFIYLKDHPFPQKGLPTPEAILAINQVKKLIKAGLKYWYLFPLYRPLFREIAWNVLYPFIIKYEFLTPAAQEVFDILKQIITEQEAKIIAHVIEYDGAYRFRLMDLCSETTFITRKEIKRLLEINKRRDYLVVSNKIQKIGTVLLLLWPWIKKPLQTANLTKLSFDAADRYWGTFKTDYKYGY